MSGKLAVPYRRRLVGRIPACILSMLAVGPFGAQAATGPGVMVQSADALPPMAGSADAPTGEQMAEAKRALFAANPWMAQVMRKAADGFGNVYSAAVANHMYSRTYAPAIDEVRKLTTVVPEGPRTWLIRMPWVNVAVFETDAGLVLVDSGYAPAGPVLLERLRELSNKPVHTIIFTHHHVDHGLGAWALLAAGEKPQIIAEERFVTETERDLSLQPFFGRMNGQADADHPRDWADLVKPTRTFRERLDIEVGGERFSLRHARAESEDQIYVWVPGRKTVVVADYYQVFLPNAGNGRRRQRQPDEWAAALRDMAALGAETMLPMHGPGVHGTAAIGDRLSAHAAMFESIILQVKTGLNRRLRKDQIVDGIHLSPALEARTDLAELYVSARDVAKMVLRQYTGWWDGIPSHWNPAPVVEEAAALSRLAGGAGMLAKEALRVLPANPALAGNLADWAFFAEPRNPEVLRAALQVYVERLRAAPPLMEATVYFDHAAELAARLRNAEAAR
jgi:glyoxylase-like metal-dependent hydrolase (beta-lactamase superfamily II)